VAGTIEKPDEETRTTGAAAPGAAPGEEPEPFEPEEFEPSDLEAEAAALAVAATAAPAAAAGTTAAAAPPIAHTPELIEQATRLMIPADEVAAMSSDELRRVIKHADRIGQTVYDSMAKKPTETTTAVKPVDELAALDDPAKYDQEFVQPIKTMLSKQAEENRVLRERLEKLEKTQTVSSQQTLHSRLMAVAAEVAPEVAKAFDLSTPTGQAKYNELLDQMGASQRHNKALTEKQLFQRAVKAMELVAEKPKESPEEIEKKRKWDAAALGKPTARKPTDTALDRVGKLLNEFKANARQTAASKTNGQSGN
jgi:hypothetical protein